MTTDNDLLQLRSRINTLAFDALDVDRCRLLRQEVESGALDMRMQVLLMRSPAAMALVGPQMLDAELRALIEKWRASSQPKKRAIPARDRLALRAIG